MTSAASCSGNQAGAALRKLHKFRCRQASVHSEFIVNRDSRALKWRSAVIPQPSLLERRSTASGPSPSESSQLAKTVPDEHKRNRWLAALPGNWRRAETEYIMFCPAASTSLRAMPQELWQDAVQRIWEQYDLPVYGVQEIEHPRYTCVAHLSRTTQSFIEWIANAKGLVSADSSAVHIAAGFDIPTLAFFTSIEPRLRVGYYPGCSALDLRTPQTSGLFNSDDLQILSLAKLAWQSCMSNFWPWAA